MKTIISFNIGNTAWRSSIWQVTDMTPFFLVFIHKTNIHSEKKKGLTKIKGLSNAKLLMLWTKKTLSHIFVLYILPSLFISHNFYFTWHYGCILRGIMAVYSNYQKC